jgi:hypothetical protein
MNRVKPDQPEAEVMNLVKPDEPEPETLGPEASNYKIPGGA